MKQAKLSIIIPTRERPDTFYHALKTCITQDYDNLTIIVSDNFGKGSTRDLVESFHDPRIKYVNTGKRVSMSDNYEFGLNQVSDGYACILGDDDGMLPDALLEINNIIQETGFKAVNWRSDQYLWPSFKFNQRANLLKVSLDDRREVTDGKSELRKLIRCSNGYERVPWLYKGFVDISAINAVKVKSGRFFNSMIPDVYSGIALAAVIDKYIYSYRPFSLDGVSNHSNGASYNMETDDKAAAQAFLSEENIPMHPGFVYCQSAYILTAESVYQAIRHNVLDTGDFEVRLADFFEAALKEVEGEPASRYKNVVDAIWFSAAYFKTDTDSVRKLLSKYTNTPVNDRYNRNVNGYNRFKNRIELKTEQFGIDNVYDATVLHKKIRNNPSIYLRTPAVFTSTLKFVIREIRKRYF